MRLPWLRQFSLKTRVVLAVALLFVGFAGLLTWLTLRHFDQNFRQSLYQEQFVLATALADAIDDKLSQNRDMLVATARLVRPAMLQDAQQAQGFLDQQAALLSIFDNGLLLISPQGQVIAEAPAVRGLRGRDVSGTDVFKGVSATDRPYLSRPFVSARAQGRPVISIGVPLFDAQGRMMGRLHGSLELLGRNFLADLNRIQIGETGYVSLFTHDRLLISHHDPRRIMQATALPGQNALLDRAIDGFEGTDSTVTSQGIAVLASFKQLRAAPWILSVNRLMSEAEAPLRGARLYLFLGAAGGTLLVLALVWLVMKRGLSPLEQLTQQVKELPLKQDAERQLKLESGGEIGTLVHAFNTMVDSLERQQRTLRESEARFRSLAEMSTDWYWEQDANFRFTIMSQGLAKTKVVANVGKARWELPIINVTPEQWDAHRALLNRHEPFRDFVYQVRAVNGELRTFSISGAPMFDAQGVFTGYRGIGSDITERQAAEQRIEFLAYHDALTGLPNRLLAAGPLRAGHGPGRAHARPEVALLSTWTSTISRPSTTRWATRPATRCSRKSAHRLRELRARHRHHQPPGRRRVPASCCATCPTPRRSRPSSSRSWSGCSSRSSWRPRGRTLGLHRRGHLPGRRPRLRDPAQEGRHGDVPRQGSRPQHLPLLRRHDERRSRRAPAHAQRPAPRAGARRVRAALPAAVSNWPAGRLIGVGGADPLAASRSSAWCRRHASSRGRGKRPDRAHRRLGAAARPAGRPWRGTRRACPVTMCRESLGGAVQARRRASSP